jgi:asparagine synthase (glutamine-hydrolysing)
LPAPEKRSEEEAVENLRQVLRDAVRSHLMTSPARRISVGQDRFERGCRLDVEASSRPVRTFSTASTILDTTNSITARVVARHFNTDHHEFVVKPDALAIIDDLIAHFDEPFGDSSAIPTWSFRDGTAARNRRAVW